MTYQGQEIPEPKITEQFWFDFSKTLVENSASKLDEAAGKIQTMLGWLWTIYTASATIGLALTKLSYPMYVNIMIALPSLFLIAGYWCAVWTQMPKREYEFEPRAPEEIKDIYTEMVTTKYFRLKRTLLLSFTAAILVAVALILASFSKLPATNTFEATVNLQDGHDTISFTGRFEPDTNILINITPFDDEGISGTVVEMPYLTDSSGELQVSIALETLAPKYNVTACWDDENEAGLVHCLERNIKP